MAKLTLFRYVIGVDKATFQGFRNGIEIGAVSAAGNIGRIQNLRRGGSTGDGFLFPVKYASLNAVFRGIAADKQFFRNVSLP